jgi:hypothetical protein
VPARLALDEVSFVALLSSEDSNTVGPAEGDTDGETDAMPDGDRDGMVEGTEDGPSDGSLDGSLDGPADGLAEGRTLGLPVVLDGAALCDGAALGSIDGELDGLLVGAVGKLLGATVGTGGTSVEQTVASKEEQAGACLSNCAAVSKRLAKGQANPVLLSP